ncbi:very short patch repair endonuclease [Frateuria defendens]|uniref:very short patch repair endonuclease n=1 Tax=Frateuria defendens TaxID=2219559 RepID=UPI001F44346B|nr:very short patch repair endonuclease [Frateuria defendens]
MGRVRQKHTGPELIVRKLVHALGGRFRLHRKDLPGSPDLVLPRRRVAVFVHGCFWHRHPGCRLASEPKSNVEFWRTKFEANVARDVRQRAELEKLGWRVVVVWECEARVPNRLRVRLRDELGLSGSVVRDAGVGSWR